MNPENDPIKNLTAISEIQTELLVELFNILADIKADNEALLTGQREILAKMGMTKEEATKRQSSAHDAALVVASHRLQLVLAKLGKALGERGVPPDYN